MKRVGLALLALVVIYLTVSHFNSSARASRSEAFTDRLLAAISTNEPVSLLTVVAEAAPDASVLCLIGPYSEATDFFPKGTSLGPADLGMVDENHVEIVALNKSGEVVEVLLVRRNRVDLVHSNLLGCYYGRMQIPPLLLNVW